MEGIAPYMHNCKVLNLLARLLKYIIIHFSKIYRTWFTKIWTGGVQACHDRTTGDVQSLGYEIVRDHGTIRDVGYY